MSLVCLFLGTVIGRLFWSFVFFSLAVYMNGTQEQKSRALENSRLFSPPTNLCVSFVAKLISAGLLALKEPVTVSTCSEGYRRLQAPKENLY